MNHFLKRNFSKIGGAGSKPDKPDPPPPPTLTPPKLGKFQSISSYSYSESIDLLCEGPIEGLVNQNGQSLENHRIFEGIYIDDVPIKKSVNPLDPSIVKKTVSLESLVSSITALWKENGVFVDKSLDSLEKTKFSYNPLKSVSDPYEAYKISNGLLSAEIILGKKNIAKAILKGRNLLSTVSTDSSLSNQEKDLAKTKLLRFGAYSTSSSIERELLKDYPLSSEYPFFCIKINLGDYNSQNSEPLQFIGDIGVNRYQNTYLEHDISNQVFSPLEISEIGKKRTLRPLGWMDMTYAWIDGDVDKCYLGGYIYVFGVHSNGFPTENTIKALDDCLKNAHIVDFGSETYNYSNVLAEIRNGEENQPPLGFFKKTYLDKQYGVKLLGPYSREGLVPRITDFDVKIPADGVTNIYPSDYENLGVPVKLSDYDRSYVASIWDLESYILKDGSLSPESYATRKGAEKMLNGTFGKAGGI